ncbi:MAG: hypothetical protein Q9217_006801 [Psora testacea]
MRASWLHSFATVILFTNNWPSVTADSHAVIPRQHVTSDTAAAATSSSSLAPSSAAATSSNAAATTATSSATSAAASSSQASRNSAASETSTASMSATVSSGVVLGTPIANMTLNETLTTTPHIDGLPIHPKITPALAVAGALLILSGAFYTLIGIKTKWLHIFLSTAYLFCLAVTVLIIYVMHPPISQAVQGAYFVAACVTGIIFGAVAVVFADVTEGLGCFLGGFCLSMWFLVLKPGGLITSTAGKVIFIACFTVGAFSLYISHYTRPYGLIGSTAFAGATVIVLGVDMFSRAGLKEFWLYVWDLNKAVFPLHYDGPYPITRGIRVEIACTILLFLLGIMSQMKVWKIVKQRREKRAADQLRKDHERDQAEEDLGRKLEEGNDRDRAMWDAVYGSKVKGKASQVDSGIGTDEPSTRKGSMSVQDVPETPEQGLEMQNIAASSDGSQKGRIIVHVGQDDDIVQQPPQSSQKLDGDSPREPSSYQPQGCGYEPAASEASCINIITPTSNKHPRTLIDPILTLKPKLIPLPFEVSAEASQHDDDQSSVATFAASDQLFNLTSKWPAGSSLIRKLSGGSKRKSHIANVSEEVLVVPHIEDDRASSVAATMDGVSTHDNSSGEALSSRDHSPLLTESKEGMTAVDPEQSPGPETIGLARSEVPKDGLTVPSTSVPQGRATGYNAGLSESKVADAKNDTTRVQAQSAESPTIPQTSEQRATPASLTDNLPEGASKVVMAYRTNEWAKHLDNAELPDVEDIEIGKAAPAISADATERSAPVDVGALQQTSFTAEPVPMVTNASPSIDDRAGLPSSDHFPSGSSNNPYFSKRQANHESPFASNNLVVGNMERTPSQNSLASNNSREELGPRSLVPKQRLSQSSMAPPRGFRNSSAPMLGNPLAESPIEEGVESSFPARFTPSPGHLMSQRDTIIRNKPSSTSLLGRHTPSSVKRTSSANSTHAALPTAAALSNIHEDDDIPLSRRKSLLQQQAQLSSQAQRTVSGGSTPYYIPAVTPPELTRNPSRISLAQVRPPEPPKHDSAISAWRASLATDPSNTSHVVQNAEIEQRRVELLAEKRRTRDSQQQAQLAQTQRRSVADKEMRRGSMLDAHRDAMRKMQGEVNKSLTNGASS